MVIEFKVTGFERDFPEVYVFILGQGQYRFNCICSNAVYKWLFEMAMHISKDASKVLHRHT